MFIIVGKLFWVVLFVILLVSVIIFFFGDISIIMIRLIVGVIINCFIEGFVKGKIIIIGFENLCFFRLNILKFDFNYLMDIFKCFLCGYYYKMLD